MERKSLIYVVIKPDEIKKNFPNAEVDLTGKFPGKIYLKKGT